MASAPELAVSRSERFLGCHASGFRHGRADDEFDFREEDIWSLHSVADVFTISQSLGRNLHVGGLSLALGQSDLARQSPAITPGRQMSTSAPVRVPHLSGILRADWAESVPDSDDDEDADEWLPPHEYLARGSARCLKAASNSVLEGVGRTLKGRDMSRVRDAVWNRTGFKG